jgi:hypothetical protein
MTQVFTDEQAEHWCSEPGVVLSGAISREVRLNFSSANTWFRFQIPKRPAAVVGLAYVIVLTDVPDYDESNFDGALVWFRRWEIWSESIDRVGYELVLGVRRSLGHEESIDLCPALVLGRNGVVSTQTYVSLPLLFSWDALYIPSKATFAASISHEGYVEIVCAHEALPALMDRFGEWQAVRI